MAATILTPADLAAELGTDARTARKFLRSITPKEDQPGKGSRWGIEKKAVRGMRTKFTAFEKAQEEAKALRDAAKVIETPTAPVSLEKAPLDGGDDFEDATDADFDALEGPTDEDLAEIDA